MVQYCPDEWTNAADGQFENIMPSPTLLGGDGDGIKSKKNTQNHTKTNINKKLRYCSETRVMLCIS